MDELANLVSEPDSLQVDIDSNSESDNPQYDRDTLLKDMEPIYTLQEKIGKVIKLLEEKLESAEEDIKFKLYMVIPTGGLQEAFAGFVRSYEMHGDLINQYRQSIDDFIKQLEKNKLEFSEDDEMGVLMSILQEKLEQMNYHVTNAKNAVDDLVAPLLSRKEKVESKFIQLETWLNHLITGIQSTLGIYVDMNVEILKKMKISEECARD